MLPTHHHILEKQWPHLPILAKTAQRRNESLPALEDPRRRWFSSGTQYNVYSTPASRTVRVIGVYAPTGSVSNAHLTTSASLTPFWAGVADADTSGPSDWIVGGNYNAHLLPSESHSLSTSFEYERILKLQQAAYRGFLAATLGLDTWEAQGESLWERHWTMVPWQKKSTRRIIDRFTVSSTLTVISTATLHGDGVSGDLVPAHLPDVVSVRSRLNQEPSMPIPGTNHRPVRTLLRLGCMVPKRKQGYRSLAPRRLRQPYRQHAAEAYGTMNEALSKAIKESPPPTRSPTSPQDCEELYLWCSGAFVNACEAAFTRPRTSATVNGEVQSVSTPALDAAKDKEKQIGRAVTKEGRLPALLEGDVKVRRTVQAFAPELLSDFNVDNALSVLSRERKVHNDVVRREERRANSISPVAAQRAEWSKAINGGKIKHLFEPSTITNPPFLLKRDDQGRAETLEHEPQEKLALFNSTSALCSAASHLAPSRSHGLTPVDR